MSIKGTGSGNGTRSVLTAAEMRALEAQAFSSGRLDSRAVMAVAGAAVVSAIEDARPDLAAAPGRAVVLCGPGNNGGDGYVVAARLAERGWRVDLCATGDPDRMSSDARAYRDAWAAAHPVHRLDEAPGLMPDAALVVDALFGIGLARPLDPDIAGIVAAVPDGAFRVAVDVPSGRETDSGAVLGQTAFAADLTVTFHAEKPVHAVLQEQGGAVRIADIGL